MDALDGGRFIVRGDGVHELVVAFVREAVEAATALLPEKVGMEDHAKADVKLVEQRIAGGLRHKDMEVPVGTGPAA